MIFSVQRFLEDSFARRGLSDFDQYAVAVANVYDRERGKANSVILKALHRIRTTFYRTNRDLVRIDFESAILSALNTRFKKKAALGLTSFPGGVLREKNRLRKGQKITISSVLADFKRAVESRAVDTFWKSRHAGQLRSGPETIAQGLLAIFAKGVLAENGLVLREVVSGTGFVDIVLVFARRPHLVEIKIMKSKYTGVEQLGRYMRIENRPTGWLVLFDARRPGRKLAVPTKFTVSSGIVNTIVIDINPLAASSLNT